MMPEKIPEPYKSSHKFSSQHRDAILSSKQVACYYCKTFFVPAEIKAWTDDNQTAICPHCHIDSVLPGAESFDKNFLDMMNHYWFGTTAVEPQVGDHG